MQYGLITVEKPGIFDQIIDFINKRNVMDLI